MSANQGWNFTSPEGGSSTGKWKKLTEGSHKIRCIGQPYIFTMHYDPVVINCCPGPQGGCPICLGGNPGVQKGVINIFDSNGQFMMLEANVKSVFSKMKDWCIQTGVEPGDPDRGPEFLITVQIPESNKRRTRYTVQALMSKPLTPEQRQFLTQNGLYNLANEKKVMSIDEINKLIAGPMQKQGQAFGQQAFAPAPQQPFAAPTQQFAPVPQQTFAAPTQQFAPAPQQPAFAPQPQQVVAQPQPQPQQPVQAQPNTNTNQFNW